MSLLFTTMPLSQNLQDNWSIIKKLSMAKQEIDTNCQKHHSCQGWRGNLFGHFPQQYMSKDVFVVIKVFVVSINTIPSVWLLSNSGDQTMYWSLWTRSNFWDLMPIVGYLSYFVLIFYESNYSCSQQFSDIDSLSFYKYEMPFLFARNVTSDQYTSLCCQVNSCRQLLLAWNY